MIGVCPEDAIPVPSDDAKVVAGCLTVVQLVGIRFHPEHEFWAFVREFVNERYQEYVNDAPNQERDPNRGRVEEPKPEERHSTEEEIAEVAPQRVGGVRLVMHSVPMGDKSAASSVEYPPVEYVLHERSHRERQHERNQNGNGVGHKPPRLLGCGRA